MDSVEKEYWARRAKDRARHHIDNPNYHHYHLYPLLQSVPPAPVWNREKKERHYLFPPYIDPNNLSYYSLLQNIPLAPVWNRGREGKCYSTPLYTNLDEAIADLHKQQQVNQVQIEPIAQINEMMVE